MLAATACLAASAGAWSAQVPAAAAQDGVAAAAGGAPLGELPLGGIPLGAWFLIGATAAAGAAFLAMLALARRWLARLSLRDRVLVALTASLGLLGVTLPAVPVLALAGVVLGPFSFVAGDLFFKLELFIFVGALIAWVPRPGTYTLFYLLWMAGQTLLSGYLGYGPIVLLFAGMAVTLVEAAGWATGLTRGRDIPVAWAGLAVGAVEAAVVYWSVQLLQAYFRFDLPGPLVLLQAASGGLCAGGGFAIGSAWGRRLRAVQRPDLPLAGPDAPLANGGRAPATDAPALLEVSGLTCAYPGSARPVVDSVSFTLRGGEIVLLAGPTGCGKSTVLRAIQGLLPAAAGSIRLDGEERAALSPARWARRCGLLMQEPDLQLLRLTPAGEAGLALEWAEIPVAVPAAGVAGTGALRRVRSAAPERGAILRALAPLDLEPLADRPLAHLSGGERLRVALAALLAGRPRVLLLDEPLAHLDGAHRQRLIVLLRALAERGAAILVAEHRVAELALSVTRVLWMEDGRVTEGPPPAPPQRTRVDVGAGAVATRLAQADAPRVVSLERVAWRFRGSAQPLFENVTAGVPAGAAILLRGANGQGKTTLLELIAGLRPPSAGRIERAAQAGRPVHAQSWRARSRWIGVLPQRADLILCARTVADELALPLRARGHDAARVRETVAEWLERLDLAGHAGRFPHLLSRGERQRLALGTVLIAAPTVLLLDEPFAGLDPRQTQAVSGFVRDFLRQDAQRAVIAATHDLEPALAWADTVWTLDNGQLSVAEHLPAMGPAAAPAALPPGAAQPPGCAAPPPLVAQGGRP